MARIIELNGPDAVADIDGNRLDINTALVPQVKLEDFVLVHAGFAIALVSEKDYLHHRRVFKEIDQYAQRCHVLLPTFWSEVIRELHRYQSHSQYMGDAIEIPSRVLAKTVKSLLTEAPGARLLQDLIKKRPQETYLDASESERINRAVAKYFQGLEGVLTEELPDPKDKISEAHNAFDGFGWGGPELEKRLIKRINQQSEEAMQSAEASKDPARAAVYAETTKLLCKLQHAVLAEPRLRQILADIKP